MVFVDVDTLNRRAVTQHRAARGRHALHRAQAARGGEDARLGLKEDVMLEPHRRKPRSHLFWRQTFKRPPRPFKCSLDRLQLSPADVEPARAVEEFVVAVALQRRPPLVRGDGQLSRNARPRKRAGRCASRRGRSRGYVKRGTARAAARGRGSRAYKLPRSRQPPHQRRLHQTVPWKTPWGHYT